MPRSMACWRGSNGGRRPTTIPRTSISPKEHSLPFPIKPITLATPYAGVLSIPLQLVRKLVVQGQGRRIIIDPAAHHLGDEFSTTNPA